jgi:cyclohexanecarboxylate-CoA ligase
VTGAAQTVGYFQRPDLYRASLFDGEWFDTGDLARRRADGGIRIAGRLKDLIIRGGENIPVAEVESALYQHPRIAEVAVVGYPDARLGVRVCALVVPDGQAPSVQDLTAHLAQLGVTKAYWPERVVVTDRLPKTASGKARSSPCASASPGPSKQNDEPPKEILTYLARRHATLPQAGSVAP